MASVSRLLCLFSTIPFIFALPAELRFEERASTAALPPRLVCYIQTFHDTNAQPLSLLPLLEEGTKVTHVYLSSVHLNANPGDINLNDVNPNSTYWNQMWSDAAELQKGGIKVMMMLGGAAQGSYQRLAGDDASFESYYVPLLQTLRYHKVDGLDLDIEEAVDVSCPLRLLNRLNADLGPDFILTMAPVASALLPNGVGLSGFDYHDLDSKATSPSRPNGKLVNWYNAQSYNGWGDASNQMMYDSIITTGMWSASRVVMGVLDNYNDGGSGFVDLPTLQSVIRQLRGNYASFGCAIGWEYWDAGGSEDMSLGITAPWQWVKMVADAVFTQQPYSANLTSGPMPDPPSPWPSEVKVLKQKGASYWKANRALNMTDGDLTLAERLLGLVDNLLGIL